MNNTLLSTAHNLFSILYNLFFLFYSALYAYQLHDLRGHVGLTTNNKVLSCELLHTSLTKIPKAKENKSTYTFLSF